MPKRDFDSIYEAYSRLVYWAAYRVLSDREATEDVTQNVFISVLKNMDTAASLDEPQLKGWLYRIAVNAALDHKRRSGRELLSDEPVGAEVADSGATPEDEAVESSEREAVRQALRRLEEPFREPLVMFYYSGMSVAEIADALGISEGTVKSRMSRGRKQLAKILREKGVDYEQR